jgi:BTB/POZ domain
VHKDLICYHSPFFNAAFTGPFLEGETQSMTLEDLDPTIFGFLVHWLYTKKVTIQESTDGKEWKAMSDLWLLAQRSLIPQLQNDAMIKLHDRLKTLPNLQMVSFSLYVYNSPETEDTPLRKLAVEILAWHGQGVVWKVWKKEFEKTSGLLYDIIMVLKDYCDCMMDLAGPPQTTADEFFVAVVELDKED